MKRHGTGHGRGKRVMAIRAMAAEIAWLAYCPRWEDGRIAWVSPRGIVLPDGADLALATRRLRQIARFPNAAGQVLGDLPAWLDQQHERLTLAGRLLALGRIDLHMLSRRARQGDTRAVETLAALLALEAYAAETPPIVPSTALASCGLRAVSSFTTCVTDTALPAAQAMTCLVLGSIDRAAGVSSLPAMLRDLGPWPRRAYGWAFAHGLPADPAVAIRLLQPDDGSALLGRYLASTSSLHSFALPAPSLLAALGRGIPPATVVGLVEAALAAGSLAERLLRYRDELPDVPVVASPERTAEALQERRDAAEAIRRSRSEAIQSLRAIFHEYALAADPAILHDATTFLHAMLDMATSAAEPAAPQGRKVTSKRVQQGRDPGWMTRILDVAIDVLRQGLALPVSCQATYLALLAREHASIWEGAVPASHLLGTTTTADLSSQLKNLFSRRVRPLPSLLRLGVDMGAIRQAIALGIQETIAAYSWHDPSLAAWAITLVERFDFRAGGGWDYSVSVLCRVLRSMPDAAAARATLGPFFQALGTSRCSARQHFLEAVLYEVLSLGADTSAQLGALTPFVPRLLAWSTADRRQDCLCGRLAACALMLNEKVPERAAELLDWLLRYLAEHPPRDADRGHDEQWSLRSVVLLAVCLMDGEDARFHSTVRALLPLARAADFEALDQQTLATLIRTPGLLRLLRDALPRQPRQCLALLCRLARLARSGELDSLDDLAHFDPGAEQDYPVDWRPLLRLSSDLGDLPARYLHARRIAGGTAQLPAGVRQVLAMPHRLRTELAHLERMLEGQPDRAGLQARARTLRARLSSSATLLGQVREEARDRLQQAVVLAEIASLEALVQRCLRSRLRRVVGEAPVPPDSREERDLLDAVLFTHGLQRNRRLLLRLLRSYGEGDRRGLAAHPANSAFLSNLAAQGVDAGAWVSAHPRVYACPGVRGGRLHLWLERDPLHILAMGTHFSTCLGAGGANAHAAVANACELNKRVIYARNAEGRIVGRQLIGIDAQWRLIGFRVYTTLGEAEGAQALRDCVVRYARAFAAHCRLPLADEGTVPTLFAAHWYDDGAVPWANDAHNTGAALRPRRTAVS